MWRFAALVAIAATLAACGGSGGSSPTKTKPVVFGVRGGNIALFHITIEPNGRVRHTGFVKPGRQRLSPARAAVLSRRVQHGFADGLTSRRCPGANPDFASSFISASGRTVAVQGDCEPSFTKLWQTLARSVLVVNG